MIVRDPPKRGGREAGKRDWERGGWIAGKRKAQKRKRMGGRAKKRSRRATAREESETRCERDNARVKTSGKEGSNDQSIDRVAHKERG